MIVLRKQQQRKPLRSNELGICSVSEAYRLSPLRCFHLVHLVSYASDRSYFLLQHAGRQRHTFSLMLLGEVHNTEFCINYPHAVDPPTCKSAVARHHLYPESTFVRKTSQGSE